MNLAKILSPVSHTKYHSNGSPLNLTKKNSYKTNCERIKKNLLTKPKIILKTLKKR